MKFEVKKSTHTTYNFSSLCVFLRELNIKHCFCWMSIEAKLQWWSLRKEKSIKKSKATRVLNLKEESQKKQSPTYLLWYGSSKTSITSKLQCLNHLEIPMGVSFVSLNMEEMARSIIRTICCTEWLSQLLIMLHWTKK